MLELLDDHLVHFFAVAIEFFYKFAHGFNFEYGGIALLIYPDDTIFDKKY